MTTTKRQEVQSIQVLRSIAAISVVLHHSIRAYTLFKPEIAAGLPDSILGTPWLRDGLAVGVDIFFVISGFIMVYGSRSYTSGARLPMEFLVKRIERIYPPYLVVTAILIVLVYFQGKGTDAAYDLQPWRIATSMMLVPAFDVHGRVAPILGVGWTLSYEMYFYIVFFVGLAAAKRRFLLIVSGIISIVWLASTVLRSATPLGEFLANPIVFDFLLGCGVGWTVLRRSISALTSLLIIPATIVIFFTSYLVSTKLISESFRVLYWGLPSAVIVCGFLSLDLRSTFRWPRFSVFLGDASYSIYLVHMLVIYYFFPRVLKRIVNVGMAVSIDELIVIILLLSITFGVLFFLLVERPIMRLVHRKSQTQ